MSTSSWKARQLEQQREREEMLEPHFKFERQRKAALAAEIGSGATSPRENQAQTQSQSRGGFREDFSNQEAYISVAQLIRHYGQPNPHFPNDFDIEYARLQEACEATGIGNLKAVLGTMKKSKRVEYRDVFLKDDSIVTLIHDYNTDVRARSDLVTYEELGRLAESEKTSHQKSGDW